MIRSYGKTDRGIVRRDNQDYFDFTQLSDGKLLLCVVCDGMGGANAGNVASSLAADTFLKTLNDQPVALQDNQLVGEALKDAALAANRVVHEAAKNNREQAGMGTTLVGAAIKENLAHIVSVGDSRAYHISNDTIRQITRDHSLVEDMIARGNITREESLHHPNRNLLTKVVGTEEKVDRDLFEVKLQAGDKLLLCTDGLTNLVTDDEILQEIKAHEDLQESGDMLVTLALAKGGGDNVTVFLVKV